MAYNNSNFNQQSSGLQQVLSGSAAFNPGKNDFPELGSEDFQNNAANSQQQVSLDGIPIVASDNPFDFKPTAELKTFAITEFDPHSLTKEEFPDLE